MMDRSFTGQTQDVLAGPTSVYDFLFRQHSSAQGRWLVPDPAGLAAVDLTNPQTWNRYAYVANNPLSFIDPLGLSDECPECYTFYKTVYSSLFGGLGVFGVGADAGTVGVIYGNEDNRVVLRNGGGRNWRCRFFGQSCPEPPPPPTPKPPKAPPVTLTCQGSASFSDASQSQLDYLLSRGGGALRPNIIPSVGTVAIGGTKTFGLNYSQLRQFGTYISVNPSDLAGMISNLGGPAPPYSVSDIGDPNIRNSSGTRFDIYAFPNATAKAFGVQNSNATTYVIPAVTGAHCPGGSQLIQGPPQ